jgi:1-acyl-sn-glycerol-3-phosphate acyltransferase
VPVAIQGSEKVRRWKRLSFPKVTVQFGEPLSFPVEQAASRERQQEVAEQIFAPVRAMYDELSGSR